MKQTNWNRLNPKVLSMFPMELCFLVFFAEYFHNNVFYFSWENWSYLFFSSGTISYLYRDMCIFSIFNRYSRLDFFFRFCPHVTYFAYLCIVHFHSMSVIGWSVLLLKKMVFTCQLDLLFFYRLPRLLYITEEMLFPAGPFPAPDIILNALLSFIFLLSWAEDGEIS